MRIVLALLLGTGCTYRSPGTAVADADGDGDGAPMGDAAASSDATAALGIGDRPSGGRAFEGRIDEARWSHAVRSAGWIATTFANQSDPGSFSTLGAP